MNKKIIFQSLLVVLLLSAATVSAQTTLTGAANNIKSVMQIITSSVVLIGWTITAILYLTSAGNPGRMQAAKLALIACVIGTVLSILAYGGIFNVINSALSNGQ